MSTRDHKKKSMRKSLSQNPETECPHGAPIWKVGTQPSLPSIFLCSVAGSDRGSAKPAWIPSSPLGVPLSLRRLRLAGIHFPLPISPTPTNSRGSSPPPSPKNSRGSSPPPFLRCSSSEGSTRGREETPSSRLGVPWVGTHRPGGRRQAPAMAWRLPKWGVGGGAVLNEDPEGRGDPA